MLRWMLYVVALPILAADPAAEGLNAFGGDLYQRLSVQRGNLVLSPLSVSTALAMTLAGARGQTAAEMEKVLRTPPDAALFDRLLHAAGKDELLMAQSLWIDRGYAVLPEFLAASKERFRAEPRPAPFSSNPEDARTAINGWVSAQTRNKINTLFGPGSLDRSTRLVLASAIYFNGKWQTRFDPKETQRGPFHSTPEGKPVETPFMNHTGRFPYAETASAQVVELPYGGGSLAFDVILPKTGVPISTVEQAFASGGIPAWLGQLQRRQVAVALPKFRAESSFSLQQALTGMGMGTAFRDSADFSGINGRRDLAMSRVVHKAFIDVTEEGTEAAAATGVGVALTAFALPTVFRADHPFLFLIRDTASGTILFAGRLETPGS